MPRIILLAVTVATLASWASIGAMLADVRWAVTASLAIGMAGATVGIACGLVGLWRGRD